MSGRRGEGVERDRINACYTPPPLFWMRKEEKPAHANEPNNTLSELRPLNCPVHRGISINRSIPNHEEKAMHGYKCCFLLSNVADLWVCVCEWVIHPLLYGGIIHFHPCQVGTHIAGHKSALDQISTMKNQQGSNSRFTNYCFMFSPNPSAEEFPAEAQSLEMKQRTTSVGWLLPLMGHKARRHSEDLIMHLWTMPDKHSTGTQSRRLSQIYFTGKDWGFLFSFLLDLLQIYCWNFFLSLSVSFL